MLGRSGSRESSITASAGHIRQTFNLDAIQIQLSLNTNAPMVCKVCMFFFYWLNRYRLFMSFISFFAKFQGKFVANLETFEYILIYTCLFE